MTTRSVLAFLLIAPALAAAEPPPLAPPPATASPPAVTSPAGSAKGHASVRARLSLPPAAPKTRDEIKPPPVSPRFSQVRARIDDLFHLRTGPPRVFDPATNPFRSAGAARTVVAMPVRTDAELLKQAAALVKVTGWTEFEGRTLLTINQTLVREGDRIKVTVQGQTLSLRADKFSRTSFTLTLNEAEITKRY